MADRQAPVSRSCFISAPLPATLVVVLIVVVEYDATRLPSWVLLQGSHYLSSYAGNSIAQSGERSEKAKKGKADRQLIN